MQGPYGAARAAQDPTGLLLLLAAAAAVMPMIRAMWGLREPPCWQHQQLQQLQQLQQQQQQQQPSCLYIILAAHIMSAQFCFSVKRSLACPPVRRGARRGAGWGDPVQQ